MLPPGMWLERVFYYVILLTKDYGCVLLFPAERKCTYELLLMTMAGNQGEF